MLKDKLVSSIEICERAVTYLRLSNLLATDTIASSFPQTGYFTCFSVETDVLTY